MSSVYWAIVVQLVEQFVNCHYNHAGELFQVKSIFYIFVHLSFPFPYPGDGWRHRLAPKEESMCSVFTLFVFLLACLLACPCDVSAILWVWKLKFGAISEDVLWQKRYFNYFFDESINWWITLIIIDLFMTYLFSFSSEQAVWHLDIWARKLIFGHDSEEVIWL